MAICKSVPPECPILFWPLTVVFWLPFELIRASLSEAWSHLTLRPDGRGGGGEGGGGGGAMEVRPTPQNPDTVQDTKESAVIS